LPLLPPRPSNASSPVNSSPWLQFDVPLHINTPSIVKTALIFCRGSLVACCTRPASLCLSPQRLEIRPFRLYSHPARASP
jgi:hypothetical protein